MAKTPTWHHEAAQRGIDYIVLVFDEAEGFAFCPMTPEQPIGMGGEHGGTHPISPDRVLDDFRQHFHPDYRCHVEWFMPFLEKIAAREDFSLDDLDLPSRQVRIVKGSWPWGG